MEIPATGDHTLDVDGHEVHLTNLDKPFWPNLGGSAQRWRPCTLSVAAFARSSAHALSGTSSQLRGIHCCDDGSHAGSWLPAIASPPVAIAPSSCRRIG